jgi:hypothetical protein
MKGKKHTKQSAGQIGGRETLARYGPEHMSAIGKRGAAVFWKRYKLEPAGLSDFAVVNRQTGVIKNFLSGGVPWR